MPLFGVGSLDAVRCRYREDICTANGTTSHVCWRDAGGGGGWGVSSSRSIREMQVAVYKFSARAREDATIVLHTITGNLNLYQNCVWMQSLYVSIVT